MKRIAYALLLAAMLPASAQHQMRFPITQHQVAHALVLHGLGIADDQVLLVAGIVARGDDPVLDIDSMQPVRALANDLRSRASIKLVCHEPQACLPFYAIVSWPPGTVLPTSPTRDRIARISLSSRGVPPPPAPVSMRAGSKATLVVETSQMHISVPVISLQDGALGAQIRVTSLDHHQTWTATILSPTLLTRSF